MGPMYISELAWTFVLIPHLDDQPYNRCSVGHMLALSVDTPREVPNQDQKV